MAKDFKFLQESKDYTVSVSAVVKIEENSIQYFFNLYFMFI